MKNTSKKTITIGIPAHNEEKNIAKLLRSILLQKADNFKIDKIIIANDGSSDRTVEIVNKFAKKYKIIKLIDDGQRLGQSGRLNQFYKNLKSDIFITFDADVIIESRHTISELIKPFFDKKVGLVGGRVYTVPPTTIISKLISVYEYFWSKVIDNLEDKNNLHSHTGPISAGSNIFLKSIKRPISITANDHFLFLSAIKNGFSYSSAKNAYVLVKVPNNLSDFIKQTTRFDNSAEEIKKYFGSWVDKYYYIPYSTKIKSYFQTFIKYPILLPISILLFMTSKILKYKYKQVRLSGTWEQIKSSK